MLEQLSIQGNVGDINYAIEKEKDSIAQITNVLSEIFGSHLEWVAFFWSYAKWEQSVYSDIDFIVLLDGNQNVDERELNSPMIKKIMNQRWISDLWAFNIYNVNSVNTAPDWFKVIISKKLVPVFDKNGALKQLIKQSEQTWYSLIAWMRKTWKVNYGRVDNWIIERAFYLSQKLNERCVTLKEYPDVAKYYELESKRLQKLATLMREGIFTTVWSFSDISKLSWRHQVSITDREMDYKYKMLYEHEFFAYESFEKHMQISEQLCHFDSIWSLQHLLTACHIEMRKRLHENGVYMVDWELTQMYFRQNRGIFSETELDLIIQVCFKSEQVCGRAGLITFDLDETGPVFADNEDEDKLQNLIRRLKVVINLIKSKHSSVTTQEKDSTNIEVSILIPSYSRHSAIKESMDRFKNLVFPLNRVEMVVVDDGSTPWYSEKSIGMSGLKCKSKLIKKEHSGITDTRNVAIGVAQWKHFLFLDDDIHMSPLTLLRLMWKIQKNKVGIVGTTTLGIPEDELVPKYAHYRWLLSWPIRNGDGVIVNVPTCCALVKAKALEIVGGFSERQWKEWIAFWGEDVDLSYRLSRNGFSLEHEPRAVVFHSHRKNVRELIKQHIGYGQWTAFHCIERGRDFKEIWITDPSFMSAWKDILQYLYSEVPKRVLNCLREGTTLREAIIYPILDITRRTSYNIWVLKTRKLKK